MSEGRSVKFEVSETFTLTSNFDPRTSNFRLVQQLAQRG